ncbi:MAG TPA: LysM peptidoglycan-binding domain-containing protein [Planctomycetota bacterium]|nr:LysM peptidoglycan-binding domain-containing protein [Planctomycetota bacterium]
MNCTRIMRRGAVLALCTVLVCLQAAATEGDTSRLMRSTVRIRYERTENGALITGHGTAFGVDLARYGYSGRRHLLSAAHNVLDDRGNPYDTLKIEINEGSRTYWSKVRVLASDQNLDVCLLESSDDLPDILALGDRDLAPGSAIFLAGSPRGIPVALFQGSVMHCFDRGTIRSAAKIPFDHGDSGGPMYCPSARRVVGVAVAGIPKDGDLDHNVGLYVPLVGLYSFLDANRKSGVPTGVPIVAQETRPIKRPAPVLEMEPAPASISVKVPVAAAPVQPSAAVPAAPIAAAAVPQPKAVPATQLRPSPEPARAVNASLTQSAAGEPEAAIKSAAAGESEAPRVHVIEPGDNLSKLAVRYKVSIKDLLTLNKIEDANKIHIGAKLLIP